MNELLQAIELKLTAILAGVTYPTPDGGLAGVAIHIGALPPKRSTAQQKQDFPFVVIRPLRGMDGNHERLATVRLICGIHEPDDVATGVASVNELADHCLGLQTAKDFTPWVKTDDPVGWESGDDREGNQPMPYYFVAIDFNFKHTPRMA